MSSINGGRANKIEVEVITADVEQGKVCSTEECVLAHALKRLGFSDIEVMADRTYIGKDAYWHDRELIDYIKDFDKGNTSLAKFVIYHIDDRRSTPKLGRPKKVSEANHEQTSSQVVDGSLAVGGIPTN